MMYVPGEGVVPPDGRHSFRVRMAKRVLSAALVAFIVVTLMFVAGYLMEKHYWEMIDPFV